MSQPRLESNTSNSSPKDTVLTEGSLWRAIWVMSWPLMLTTICTSLIGIADLKVSSILGSAPQAAVGVSEQILFTFQVFILSTSVATTAIVSRAFGANDSEHTSRATAQSITFSLCMGLFLSALCFLIGRHGIHLLSSSADVLKNSSDYLSIYSFYLIPFSITAIVNSAFRAVGNARIPLVIVAITTVINITGDYLTVICNWPIPGLGIRGVALSGLTASSFGSMLALAFLSRSILKDSFSKILPIDFNQLKTIIKIGFPSGLQRLLWALSVFMLFYILRYSDHPTEAIASWTIGMRVEGLVFMPLMALSLAVSSIVGQNLGAKQPERAFKAGWQVTKIGLGLMLVLGSAMFFLSNRLAHQMSIDPFTITYTSNYLRINAFSEPFLAFGMIMAGALQGAGDTRTPMWISLATHWMIRMPVAALLVIGLKVGPTGAWIAMALSIVLMGLLTLWRYQSKAWITTEV